jgi:hypothetical protein
LVIKCDKKSDLESTLQDLAWKKELYKLKKAKKDVGIKKYDSSSGHSLDNCKDFNVKEDAAILEVKEFVTFLSCLSKLQVIVIK